MEPLAEYISTKEAADLAGYTRQYIATLLKSGKVKGKMIGGRWLVLRQSILEYKAQQDNTE